MATRRSAYFEAVQKKQKDIVERALKRFDGNRSKTARYLGIERGHLRYLIRRHGISGPAVTIARRPSTEEIYQRDGGVCRLCHEQVERNEASVDHIVPSALGGGDGPANLRLAHKRCNEQRRSSPALRKALLKEKATIREFVKSLNPATRKAFRV